MAPLGQVDDGTAKPSRFSIQVVCRNFLELWRLNTKKSVSLRDSEIQTFLEGRKTKIQKEKPKVTYSVALVLAFFSAENENRKLEDLPLDDFGLLPERLLLSVRKKSINENFVN